MPASCGPAMVPALRLDYGEIDTLRERYGPGGDVFPLPEMALTSPASIVEPHPASANTGEWRIANREEVY